jgi:hypothetical protein
MHGTRIKKNYTLIVFDIAGLRSTQRNIRMAPWIILAPLQFTVPDCQHYFEPFFKRGSKQWKIYETVKKRDSYFMSFMDTDDKHKNDINVT